MVLGISLFIALLAILLVILIIIWKKKKIEKTEYQNSDEMSNYPLDAMNFESDCHSVDIENPLYEPNEKIDIFDENDFAEGF